MGPGRTSRWRSASEPEPVIGHNAIVPPDLPPEQEHELEEFIRQADRTAEFQPAWVRPRLLRGRRMAALVLRLAGPDGTPQDQRELEELAAGESPVPWSWVERGPSEANGPWTDDRVPQTVDERRHKRQKQFAEKVVRAWVGHPAVASHVEAARPELSAIVEPLALLDQGIVTVVTADFLGGSSFYPDGSRWPNPFVGAPEELCELAEQIQRAFMPALQELAERMEAAGVPLDPNDPSVLLALSQLTLLTIDLKRPAKEIVAGLNVWPPGFIDGEAAVLGNVAIWASRLGNNIRFLADLISSAGVLARRLGPPAIRATYANGEKRQPPLATQRLREALADLVRQDPTLSPAQLLAIAGGVDHPALGRLREAMHWEPRHLPDIRTLERNWPKSRR
jgi:hypothetical protein